MNNLSTISENGTVLIGKRIYTVAVPIYGGDCMVDVKVMNAIEFHDFHTPPGLHYFATVFGEFNIYTIDSDSSLTEISAKLMGKYDIYSGHQLAIFVKI